MLDWKKVATAAGLLVVSAGCQMTTSERVSTIDSENKTLVEQNEELLSAIEQNKEWRRNIIRYEDKVSRLESIVEPLAPLKEKNMELMATNAREGEEAGGGALSEIFYLVQTAYSELDLQAANLANDINTSFNRDDFVQTYLYDQLEDQVVEITLDIAEVVTRRSTHMAIDRRLVVARLKALQECYSALRNLSENKVFDLSYRQRTQLLDKIDVVRVEYAKTLKTDYFPAIPHFVPMASGEDYLKSLEKMSAYIESASIFFADANKKRSGEIFSDLEADLKHKRDVLKADTIK
ncbi:MAG: hypothetical protein HQL32_04980 [Planctomycetes bacterium]|nr:hypothetical protein [Planctomycetota bacterium]